MRFWHIGLLLIEGAVSLACTVLDDRQQPVRGTLVSIVNDTVVVRTLDDGMPQTDRVSPAATITRDGRPARLADLKAGDIVQLMVGSSHGPIVTEISAKTLEAHPPRLTHR